MAAFRRVVIESPFRASTRRLVQRNVAYALAAVRDAIDRGESPYLSHLIIPGALDDHVPVERELGIMLGYAWWSAAEAICFYCDLGWSQGMLAAKERAIAEKLLVEERCLAKDKHSLFRPGFVESQ